MFGMLEGVVDIRVANPGSLYFFDQLSCIIYFHWGCGLKDIDFRSFIHFNSISEIILLLNQHYPKQCI